MLVESYRLLTEVGVLLIIMLLQFYRLFTEVGVLCY